MLRCSPLALKLGFSSHSHFTDVFQRSFGQIAVAKNKQDFEGLIQQYRLVFPGIYSTDRKEFDASDDSNQRVKHD